MFLFKTNSLHPKELEKILENLQTTLGIPTLDTDIRGYGQDIKNYKYKSMLFVMNNVIMCQAHRLSTEKEGKDL